MARSYLTATPESLIDDSGTVLWSFIRGEQLEFPVVVNFLDDATSTSGFVFVATVLEAENSIGQTAPPTTLQDTGDETILTIRQMTQVSSNGGNWNASQAYNTYDLVFYDVNSKYYTLASGTNRVSAITPDVDPLWDETTKNTLFIQFPTTLGNAYAVKPKIGWAVYGFFELSVQEPVGVTFRRLWKPVRGMVQMLFSPISPDP